MYPKLAVIAFTSLVLHADPREKPKATEANISLEIDRNSKISVFTDIPGEIKISPAFYETLESGKGQR